MKKIIMMSVMIFAFCGQVFAQFEIEVKIPVGFSFISTKSSGNITIPLDIDSGVMTDKTASVDSVSLGVLLGAMVEVGYNFKIENQASIIGISLLADLGYHNQLIETDFTPTTFPWGAITYNQDTLFHIINIGLLHKLNMYTKTVLEPFAIGLGYGVKLPVAAKTIHEFAGIKKTETFSASELQEQLSSPVFGYVKFVFDAYNYISEKYALVYGMYFAYNFGLGYSESGLESLGGNIKELSYQSFDIGLTMGFAFGKSNPRI